MSQVQTWHVAALQGVAEAELAARIGGPHRGTYYRLYVILDLFSRFIVGWMLAHTENGKLAARLLRDACDKQGSTRPTSSSTPIAAPPRPPRPSPTSSAPSASAARSAAPASATTTPGGGLVNAVMPG